MATLSRGLASRSEDGAAAVRLPQGVVDHPPERARAISACFAGLERSFHVAGYDRVFPPSLELLEVVERGLGNGARRSLFRLVDPSSGEVLVLRPDFTAQVARMVVARMAERPKPLRLCYSGRVVRAVDGLGRGLRMRDVFQAGVELIGSKATWSEAEVLRLAAESASSSQAPLTLNLGHAAIVEALLSPGRDRFAVLSALSSKDTEKVSRVAPELLPLVDLYGDRKVLAAAKRVLSSAPDAALDALERLDVLATSIEAMGLPVALTFDLGEPRGLDYYTGLFFQGYVQGAPQAVLSGGRYDDLLGRFGAPEPAVGFAVDVGGLVASLEAADERAGVVVIAKDGDGAWAEAELGALRGAGIRAVRAEPESALEYARAHGFAKLLQKEPDGSRREIPVR